MPAIRTARNRARISSVSVASRRACRPSGAKKPTYLTRTCTAMYRNYMEPGSTQMTYESILAQVRQDAQDAEEELGPQLERRVHGYIKDLAFTGYIDKHEGGEPFGLTDLSRQVFNEIRQQMPAEHPTPRAELWSLCSHMQKRIQRRAQLTKNDLHATVNYQSAQIRDKDQQILTFKRRLREHVGPHPSLQSIWSPDDADAQTDEHEEGQAAGLPIPCTPIRPRNFPNPYPTPESQPRPSGSGSRRILTPIDDMPEEDATGEPEDRDADMFGGHGADMPMDANTDDDDDVDMADGRDGAGSGALEALQTKIDGLEVTVVECNTTIDNLRATLEDRDDTIERLEQRHFDDQRAIGELEEDGQQFALAIAVAQLDRRADARRFVEERGAHQMEVQTLTLERDGARQETETAKGEAVVLRQETQALHVEHAGAMEAQAQAHATELATQETRWTDRFNAYGATMQGIIGNLSQAANVSRWLPGSS
ncbi:hypothetical protein HGRIS_004934 [Hohenbuehelia grisea]|uniref:Uncharacterized protein n=1 Tax=Hohenbuehelia grisea TaxID=104357 RepID=A0ABR3JDG7_9AGAR